MRNLIKNKKGSYTIELTMVFTIIILAVLTLMFTFAYMLQKVSVVRLAAFAAQQGAEIWTDSRKNLENGMADADEDKDSLYFRVKDNLLFGERTFNWSTAVNEESYAYEGLPGKKAADIKDSICNNLEGSVLEPGSTDISVSLRNNMLKGKITVEITQEVKIPIKGIAAFLGDKDAATMQGRAVSAIVEPAEYIRNIDLAVELSRRIGDELNFRDILKRVSGEKQQ